MSDNIQNRLILTKELYYKLSWRSKNDPKMIRPKSSKTSNVNKFLTIPKKPNQFKISKRSKYKRMNQKTTNINVNVNGNFNFKERIENKKHHN